MSLSKSALPFPENANLPGAELLNGEPGHKSSFPEARRMAGCLSDLPLTRLLGTLKR